MIGMIGWAQRPEETRRHAPGSPRGEIIRPFEWPKRLSTRRDQAISLASPGVPVWPRIAIGSPRGEVIRP